MIFLWRGHKKKYGKSRTADFRVTKECEGADESLFDCEDQRAPVGRLRKEKGRNAVIVLTSASQPCQTHLLHYRSVASQCFLSGCGGSLQRHIRGDFLLRVFFFFVSLSTTRQMLYYFTSLRCPRSSVSVLFLFTLWKERGQVRPTKPPPALSFENVFANEQLSPALTFSPSQNRQMHLFPVNSHTAVTFSRLYH